MSDETSAGENMESDSQLALRLTVAITRLRARLRAEALIMPNKLTISQLAVLQRLLDEGSATAASLAAAEHVTPQSIAQSLDVLKKHDFVVVRPHPVDGRKREIAATDAGRRYVDSLLSTRVAWLADAIREVSPGGDRSKTGAAVELLETLASVEVEKQEPL
jgi:DNA-binding MarR family transcriptional regulator